MQVNIVRDVLNILRKNRNCYLATGAYKLIDAARIEARTGGIIELFIARVFRPLIQPDCRPATSTRITRALLEGVSLTFSGEHIIESEHL